MEPNSKNVGIYCRISFDLENDELGVMRQEQDCRKLAQLRGWTVKKVYIDNNLSASKRDVIRPEFMTLLEDIRNGAIDGVVVYDLDRFTRQPVELEKLLELYEARDLVFSTVSGDIDLSTSGGQFVAGVLVNHARLSSKDTARRVARKHLEQAQAGIPVGGNRPFGWNDDKRTLHLVESELKKQAFADILAGVSLGAICKVWQATGVTTPSGKPWQQSMIKAMLLSPRNVGYRTYRGEILLDETGEPVKGQWEIMVDLGLWDDVKAILTDPTRKGTREGSQKYLLSSIIKCGVCGRGMTGNWYTNTGKFSYNCPPPSNGGCGKVSISGDRVDELITKLVLAYLANREIQQDTKPWPDEAKLTRKRAQVTELMAAYQSEGPDHLDGALVFPRVNKLNQEVKALTAERNAWTRDQTRKTSTPTDVVQLWPDMETAQRRSVIRSLIVVVVNPRTTKGKQFNPDRVDIVWL